MSDLQTHLDPELVEMLNRLRLVPALPVSARHAGTHRSRLRGGPVEFAEHRHYSPGDDLRGVDWKLYGRTDRYFVRQNVDDSSLRCLILLDATGSMTFRSQAALAGKFEFARRLAAAIAWVVVNQQDEVGLIPFPDSTGHVITPRAGRGQLDVMSDALDQIPGSN